MNTVKEIKMNKEKLQQKHRHGMTESKIVEGFIQPDFVAGQLSLLILELPLKRKYIPLPLEDQQVQLFQADPVKTFKLNLI